MARSKHSTALFEVISKGNHPEAAAQSLRTPKWWFKGHQTAKTAPAEAPAMEEPAGEAPVLARRSGVLSRLDDPMRSKVHVAFDRQRKQVLLKMRYTTALLGGFGLCTLIAVGYVIGRHMSRGPQAASASEHPRIDALMQQPPQRNVVEVIPGRTTRASSPVPEHLVDRAPAASARTHNPAAPSLVPAGVETRMPRAVALNYAVIQSYPPQELAAAQAAMEFLTRKGIACTLEHLADYNPRQGWVCLVGTAGFTKVKSKEYETYVSHIMDLAKSYQTSRFDRFDPHPYKWKG